MIRKFIVQCALFTAFCLLICLAIWLLLMTQRHKMMDMQGTHILFLGNSLVQTGVDDHIVSDARNFARSAEAMEYVYAKVKLAKRYNPQLDTVIIDFDNVMPFTPSRHPELFSPLFFDIYTPRDAWGVVRFGNWENWEHHFSHPFDALKLYDFGIAMLKPDFNMRDANAVGGYLPLQRFEYQKFVEEGRENIYVDKEPKPFNELALYFMDRTVDFCRANGITLMFLVTPQPPQQNADLRYKHLISTRYAGVPLLDFRERQMPDSCYGDLIHLNVYGARQFSQFLEDSVLHRR